MSDKKKIPEPLVYIPEDAEINIGNNNMTAPKTKYDKRRVIFDREKVNNVVKGNYGARK